MPAEDTPPAGSAPPGSTATGSPAAQDAKAASAHPADEYDSPWKEAIEGAFPEFMAFYFPQAHGAIAWEAGHEFLDKELRQVVRDAASGKKFVDVLVRVTGRDAVQRLLYVHVEVQTQRDEAFAWRMFTYHHRLIDRRGPGVASFAVLADESPGWRPTEYRIDVLGCEHIFRFPTAKLLDNEPRLAELKHNANPFALVTAAHLSALRTRHDTARRFAAKRELVRLLYTQGWQRQRVIDLFTIIDWMLTLPKPQERRVWQDIEQIERKAEMKYVTSVERLAIERGRKKWVAEGRLEGKLEGKLETLTRLLTRRFGPLPEWATERMKTATADQFDLWADRVLDAVSLTDVFGGH
jgi:hypothetical protein